MITAEKAVEIFKKEFPDDTVDSVWENKKYFFIKPRSKKIRMSLVPYIEKNTGKIRKLLPPDVEIGDPLKRASI